MSKNNSFCPICGEPNPSGKSFCCKAHEDLFYSEEDFGWLDEGESKEDYENFLNFLLWEEKKSKCF